MKKFICLMLACVMLCGSAFAAEWGPGRSPAKPYDGVNEVDLEATMGYILLYPRTKLPAKGYCDTLTIYLPREDITLASGKLTLYHAGAAEGAYDFSDAAHVTLRKLTEDELTRLVWGSGVCIEVRLDTSLIMGDSYYVLMDEGCFTNTSGTLKSLQITNREAWQPTVTGDYGVNALHYNAPYAEGETATPNKARPNVGDTVTFDLVMGGDAVSAVVFSDNDSVHFDVKQYTESGAVSGTVVGEELNWGIVFINSMGDIIDVITLGD